MLKNDLVPVSFFESMSSSRLFSVKYAKKNKDWQRLKRVYDDNYIKKIGNERGDYKIPKKIHQIWLGGELPNKYFKWCQGWKIFHPEWEYKLWTDKDARSFKMVNREAFDLVDNLGAKSDIFRLEILYKYGGIYVDTDFECLKPFDEICKMTSLFAGLVYDKKPTLANGLIGSSVKNKILTNYIEDIGKLVTNVKRARLSTGKIMKVTGPYKFSEKCLEYIINDGGDFISFPVTFFYPFPSYERFCKEKKMIESYVREESMAIHYWSASWVEEPNVFGRMYQIVTRLMSKFI